MTIRNLSNTTAEEMVQAACNAFEEKGMLQFHVNCNAASIFLTPGVRITRAFRCISLVLLDKDQRNILLTSAAKKVDDAATFFFHGLDRNTYCIDKNIRDRFMNITKEKYPNTAMTRQFALVDIETETELMSIDTAEEYVQLEGEEFPLTVRVSTFVAQRNPNPDFIFYGNSIMKEIPLLVLKKLTMADMKNEMQHIFIFIPLIRRFISCPAH
ncbi:MAG: hypothetical protein WAM28_03520 [Chlamydiales bacterium]